MRLVYPNEDGETLTSSKYLIVHCYIVIDGENHIFQLCELQYSLKYDSFGPVGYPTGSSGWFRVSQLMRFTSSEKKYLRCSQRCQHICPFLGDVFCFFTQ